MRLMGEHLPAWLLRNPPQDCLKVAAKYKKTQDYFRHMQAATPKWLTKDQKREFYRVYKEMRRLRKLGHNVVVDHIVPVRSLIVCGLQVPWNLAIVPYQKNSEKLNTWWPDCPHDKPITDLFAAPEQFKWEM